MHADWPFWARNKGYRCDRSRRFRDVFNHFGQNQRRFGRISLVAFSTTLLASWESIACLLQDGLINGGPASLVYGLLFAFAGSLATCASLAEMTSMLPTSAGQYHWVAELAPIRYAKSLSYAAGMITGFARLSIAASASYVAATEIQGLLVFNIESYESHD
ncbi:MAG: hypothetical protein LQ349_007490 [Xanthoria aureola]|nr:MAG: hypothetical protein LQ349_007490 [Xanthoria aureola]